MSRARATAKFLLIGLVAANLAVAAAWLVQDQLTAFGILPAPEPSRVELEARPLPAIGSSEEGADGEEHATATTDAADTRLPEEPGPAATAQFVNEEEGPPPEDLAAPASPGAPANAVCALVGPFSERGAAQTAAAGIRAAGGSVEWQLETVSVAPTYLVYVVPAAAKDEAVETWRALRAQSIEAFIIPSGERKNGISVGVFAEQPRAAAQRERVAKLGHAVQVVAMERSATVFRLLARTAPEALIGQPYVACKR